MLDTLKRLLVGRPLATSEQEHQRISKVVALAVFSSDAISSTAYATEEILFVIAVGAVEPRARALEARADRDHGRDPARDRRDVVPPDDLRLSERRRLLHRQPREPRRDAVARRGRVAARRLHPHGGGVDLGRRRRHHLDPAVREPREAPRRGLLRDHPLHHARQPARHQGVGPPVRVPDVRATSSSLTALVFLGLTKTYFGWFGGIQPIPFDPSRPRSRRSRQTGGTLELVRAAARVLVGRGRADRRRGDLQRRARVPAQRVEERGHHPRVDGARSSARCSWACRSSPTTCSPYPSEKVTVFAQMGKQVFGDNVVFWVLQLTTAGILTLAANTAYADFPRLSSIIARDGYLPRQLANRGDRLVFSNGVLVLAGVACAADLRVRRQDQRADPALRGRRVHLVHAVAGGHGAAPPEGTRAALEARRRDQRRRLGRDRDRRGDHRGHEVHQGRVDPDRRDPGDRRAVQGDQAATTTTWRRRSAGARRLPSRGA